MKKLQKNKGLPRSVLVRLVSGLAAIAVCCMLVRVTANSSDCNSPDSIGGLLSYAAEKLTQPVLFSEDNTSVSLIALFIQSSALRQYSKAETPGKNMPEKENSQLHGTLYYEILQPEEQPVLQETAVKKEYIPSDYNINASYVKIKNNSGLDIDVSALLKEKLKLAVSSDEPTVLIIHTHGSEAYTPDDNDTYEVSDTFRTQDPSKSVISLGTILSDELNARGVNAIHDTGVYDYPSYAGSYNRTYESICRYLEKYPSISIVIDLHRDASEVAGSLDYKTTAEIDGKVCSQAMFVVGTNASGLDHPNWRENLKFALNMQCAAEDRYPGLMRPISISKNRYNQHATLGSLILEVGYCGNTLDESRKTVRLFADVVADVILPLKQVKTSG